MRKYRLRIESIVIGFGLFVWGAAIYASGPDLSELTKNHQKYLAWNSKNQSNSEIPFYLETKQEKGGFTARMGIIGNESLQNLAKPLRDEHVWCKFMLLHLNIKSCATWINDDGRWITFYMGKKSYQTPEDAEPLILEYRTNDGDDLISVEMYAKDGPYGTSDYRIQLYVIPVKDGVYGELRMSQRFGFFARKLSQLYLNTVAKDKVGFSIESQGKGGKVKYVGGQQGVAERNIVRYILAIQVFLQTQKLPSENLFQKRAELWFDETERYRRQLHELNRDEYLQNKKLEYKNQIRLQNKYDALAG